MSGLTRMEEMILLAIVDLQQEAYLVAISDHLSKLMEKKYSLNSIHLPLSRLEKAGLIKHEMGDSSAVRGGRRKKIYSLTLMGYRSLEKQKKINEKLWKKFTRITSQNPS